MNGRVRVLILSGLLTVAAATWLAVERHPGPPGPVLRRSMAETTRAVPPPLSAGAILVRRDVLQLTPEQVSRLESLVAAWADESAAVEAAVVDAQARFTRFAEGSRGATVSALQRESADYRELSAELRERRWRHGEVAVSILTEEQRRRLPPSSSPQPSGEQR